MDIAHDTMKRLELVLAPYGLRDSQELAYAVWATEHEGALTLHEASLVRMARDVLLQPQGGCDVWGDLGWGVGPAPQGLPQVSVQLMLSNRGPTVEHTFLTASPFTASQLAHDCMRATAGAREAIYGYIDELDALSRANMWRDIARDCHKVVRRIEDAQVLARSARLPTLLRDAIVRGDAEGVEDALDLGADSNGPDASGNRPLHLAVMNERHELITPLIHAGAVVNATNAQGRTALHLAAGQHYARGCMALMAHGGDPHQVDAAQRTPADHGRGRWRPRRVEHAQGL